jgi:hypothetical protein
MLSPVRAREVIGIESDKEMVDIVQMAVGEPRTVERRIAGNSGEIAASTVSN